MSQEDFATLMRHKDEYVVLLQKEAPKVARRLYELGVFQVILFGSVAEGNASIHSDLDLMVIWDTPLSKPERTAFLYQKLGPVPVPVDLIVLTPAETVPERRTQFLNNIFHKGVRL